CDPFPDGKDETHDAANLRGSRTPAQGHEHVVCSLLQFEHDAIFLVATAGALASDHREHAHLAAPPASGGTRFAEVGQRGTAFEPWDRTTSPNLGALTSETVPSDLYVSRASSFGVVVQGVDGLFVDFFTWMHTTAEGS